jgi:hypothetical protein
MICVSLIFGPLKDVLGGNTFCFMPWAMLAAIRWCIVRNTYRSDALRTCFGSSKNYGEKQQAALNMFEPN